MSIRWGTPEKSRLKIRVLKFENVLDKGYSLILGKFGKISDELRKRIQGEANVTVLDTWLLIAAKASSLEEFVQSMNSSMSV